MRRDSRQATAAALALLLVAGCGGGSALDSSSSDTSTEATVTGTVRVFDKALTGGTVTFDPSNIDRKAVMPHSATIGKDGSYTITTLVGQNLVSVSAPETTTGKGRELQYEMVSFDVPREGGTFDITMPLNPSP